MSGPSTIQQTLEKPRPVTLSEAFWYWLKLGFISFGGPAGQIAIMHRDLVEQKRWISEKRFLHALNYCMVLPGPEAQQLATYIGWLMHRTWGGLIAGGLFVLPATVILMLLTWIYLVWGQVPAVAGVLYGIKPAVTAIVLFAAYRIGSRALKHPALYGIAALSFVAIALLDVPFPAIILGAALLGMLGGKFAPQIFNGGGHGAAKTSYGPALIDDDTPPPAHAAFSWGRFVAYLGAGVLIGGVTAWGIAALFPAKSAAVLNDMSLFFTKSALLTFGGAYAVLPYVAKAAVEHFGWLTAAQMIDGLALGETTPGPLILIVTFVGFVGAWTKGIFGGEALLLAGISGGLVATFFTFLPSFIFIFAGAPYIESTRDNLKLAAPLTAISAAVVGVIVNLALFFATHVFFPKGVGQPPDWVSVAIGVAAFVALFKFNLGMIKLIGACAALGLALRLGGVV